MAFNLSRYNLQPYNAGGSKVFWLKVAASEKVNAQIGTGTLTFLQCNGFEQVSASSNGTQGRFIKGRFSEVVTELITEAQMSVLLDAIADEAITGEVEQAAEIRPAILSRENVTAISEIGSNIYLDGDVAEEVQPAVILGSKIYPAAEMYELVDAAASLLALDTRVCIINTTLRPGQRLIIDAATYNVLLDSKNAIHLHSGEWIDELSRETTEISVTARSGAKNLSASILYTERYL